MNHTLSFLPPPFWVFVTHTYTQQHTMHLSYISAVWYLQWLGCVFKWTHRLILIFLLLLLLSWTLYVLPQIFGSKNFVPMENLKAGSVNNTIPLASLYKCQCQKCFIQICSFCLIMFINTLKYLGWCSISPKNKLSPLQLWGYYS